MFWNKKDYVKRFDHEIVIAEIAKMIGGVYKVNGCLKIPGDKRITNTELANKLDLILDHLKLKYVPETETKEPAKLVEKMGGNSFFDNLKHGAIVNVPNAGVSMPMPMSVPMSGGGGRCSTSGPTPTKPKKKGRPKKK